jgi:hypothetical protein
LNTWAWTYDPRAAKMARKTKVEGELPPSSIAHGPLDLFPKQEDLVDFVEECLREAEDGLVEKSRDVGFTWTVGGIALHHWRFVPGFRATFGSRKTEFVDGLGDPDTIFEKIRYMLYNLPVWLRPPGFEKRLHDHFLLLTNPETGNTIGGEGGDEMGRGGRSTLYVLDEYAFVPRADKADMATSANADCRIFGSSANGMGNAFARKRFAMPVNRVFRLHWRDDPRKTEEWAKKKKASMIEEWKWASEYEIDYAASIEGVCIPAKWVEAALRIGSLVALEPAVKGVSGLDVGGGGKGKSVHVARFGPVVLAPESWGNPDTIETAHKGLGLASDARPRRKDGAECRVTALNYDAPGIGAGVSAAMTRANKKDLWVTGVNTGVEPSTTRWPDGESSEEKFVNLKAEMWFIARSRFKATYETLRALEGDPECHVHPPSDLISLPPGATNLVVQLSLPKMFRTEKGKMILETKTQLATRGVPSPDEADALMLTFVPTRGPIVVPARAMERAGAR